MLSKITKSIGFGVIIELSELCALGNRIDVFYEGGPTLVAEGIGGVELPAELSDLKSELWHWNKYGSRFQFIGLRLNFPKEIIQDCEDKFCKIIDETLLQALEEIVSTQNKFHAWCKKQKSSEETQHTLHLYAYLLKKVNEKKYFIPKEFCKRIDLGSKLNRIHLKGSTPCLGKLVTKTSAENYLGNFEELINYMCRQIEEM